VVFTHFFSSHLRRAVKTAELIRDAQPCAEGLGVGKDRPAVISLPILREKDFGYYEGKPYYTMSKELRSQHENHPDFADVESKKSLAERMDSYLEEYLLPLIRSPISDHEHVVSIVGHGVILSTLWRRLLVRLPRRSVKCLSEVLAVRKTINLEHLGGYSNTGYLELHLENSEHGLPPRLQSEISYGTDSGDVSETTSDATASNVDAAPSTTRKIVLLDGRSATIVVINGQEHLKGLKRAGGGVGSARHDEGQKTIDTFFKRRKTG